MNQTEIPNIRTNNENSNRQNQTPIVYSRPNSKITVIRGGIHEKPKDNTARLSEPQSSAVSQNKIVRISSSKGIRVISRQSSTQKQPSQFTIQSSTDMSQKKNFKCPQSQTSINLEKKPIRQEEKNEQNKRRVKVATLPQYLEERMRKQLLEASQKYEEKMNQELSFQYNTFTLELDRTKQLLAKSNQLLHEKQIQISALKQTVEKVEKSINKRVLKIQNQLQNMKAYFMECNKYTLDRISSIEIKSSSMADIIQKQTNPNNRVTAWQLLEQGYSIAKNIAIHSAAKSIAVKVEADDQLFDHEITLSNILSKLQELEISSVDMKGYIFLNESLKISAQQINNLYRKFHQQINMNNMLEPLNKVETRIQQILKRINSSAIEIQLTNNLLKNQQKAQAKNEEYEMMKQNYQNIISTLKKQRISMQKQIVQVEKKIEAYSLKNFQQQEQIKNLQKVVQDNKSKSRIRQNQITDLRKKIAYYEIKLERSSQLEVNLQTSLAEAYSQSMLKQKVQQIENSKSQEIRKHIQTITEANVKIKQLDHENFLLAQKLNAILQNQNKAAETKKLELELNYIRQESKQLVLEVEKLKAQNQSLLKKLQQISYQRDIIQKQQLITSEELKTLKRELLKKQDIIKQIKLSYNQLIEQNQKLKNQYQNNKIAQTKKDEDNDEKYTQQELLDHIQELQQNLQQLSQQNISLKYENEQLQENLQQYAETFEKQSQNFRSAIQKLQKDKNIVIDEMNITKQQNKFLKKELNQINSSTVQSFYENRTPDIMNLKRTCSTELSYKNRQIQKDYMIETPSKRNNSSLIKVRKQESLIQMPKNSSRMQNEAKVMKLKKIFINQGYKMPVVCEIDATGNIKCQKTGIYFLDENDNPFEMSALELQFAIQSAIILL